MSNEGGLRHLSFALAINEALSQAMRNDKSVIVYGLGVDDPKRIFGTTAGLVEEFGRDRVFDTPTAENAMTGIGVGAALGGLRPVMIHQRLDFFLLAMDQLVNSAAKWHYMFGGTGCVPLTIRLVVGRGWGQGPTHSQSLQSWFAHIPGLKVVIPSTPQDAKSLLLASIRDNNPVLFIEHRWLHESVGEVAVEPIAVSLGSARLVHEGSDISLVSYGQGMVEVLHAQKFLSSCGISAEVVDLRTIVPLDWDTVYCSVRKTGRLIMVETSHQTASIGSEVIARVASQCWQSLRSAPQLLAKPDIPEPTSFALTKDYYPTAKRIVNLASELTGKSLNPARMKELDGSPLHDIPGSWFKGPF